MIMGENAIMVRVGNRLTGPGMKNPRGQGNKNLGNFLISSTSSSSPYPWWPYVGPWKMRACTTGGELDRV